MKILVLSSDPDLLNHLSKMELEEDIRIKIYSELEDEIDGISKIYSQNPSIIILDDDLIKPNSQRYISTIRKANKQLKIIFLTSDNSVEFGRNIVSNGVSFYGIKPLEEKELNEYIKSTSKQINLIN